MADEAHGIADNDLAVFRKAAAVGLMIERRKGLIGSPAWLLVSEFSRVVLPALV